jgi:outer membrane protein OmpA-like peptidoglycan-associated protein
MKLRNPECMLINNSPMLADTIRTANWYHLMCRFTPADTLNYLFIGAFYNPAAPYVYQEDGGGCDFGFFIDDVELPETPENAPAPVYPGPESTEVQSAEEDTETRYFVYFDSNSDMLTAAAEASLDTVIALASSDMRSVFQINGHADILGAGNEALSERRAHRVKSYLEQKGVLPDLRLEIHAYGSDSLAADNATETGRRLSRRVEIRKSDKDLPFILYKSAGQTADADSACRLLQAWLRFPTSDGMLLLHDPDLNKLHAYSSWTRLTEQIKAAYGKFKNPALAYELEYLYFKDQRYRSLAGVFLEAKGSVPRLIDSLSQDARIQHLSDSLNAEVAVRLLEKYGWADPATVGARAASAPFYPIQHAENLPQMKKALETLQAACEKKYAPWLEYAMLYDRTQLIETGLQHFGTQYRVDQNDPSLYRLAPLDDPANIDTIRAKLNLGLLDPTSTFRVLLKKK